MDSEMREILTAVLEGQQFLGARIEALSADTKARIEALSADTKARIEALSADTKARFEASSDRFEALSDKFEALSDKFEALSDKFEALSDKFEALSTKMEAYAADTNAKLDLLTVDMAGVKAQVVDVSERLHYLSHKTADLEQDMFMVKKKQGA